MTPPDYYAPVRDSETRPARRKHSAVLFRYRVGAQDVCRCCFRVIALGERRWTWVERDGSAGVGCRTCIFEAATRAPQKGSTT